MKNNANQIRHTVCDEFRKQQTLSVKFKILRKVGFLEVELGKDEDNEVQL